jgi:hypothetical protein
MEYRWKEKEIYNAWSLIKELRSTSIEIKLLSKEEDEGFYGTIVSNNYIKKLWRVKKWRTFTHIYVPNESFRANALFMSSSFSFL